MLDMIAVLYEMALIVHCVHFIIYCYNILILLHYKKINEL